MRRITARALVGLGLGLGFAVLEFVVLGAAERVFHDHTIQPMRSFDLAFRILNAPADGLGYVWHDVFHLPPHSELAWVLVPVVTVLMQWGLAGLLAGLWWGFKSASSAKGGGSHLWPVFLGGAGVIVGCGLLALIFGAVFSRPAQHEDPKAHPKPSVAAREEGPFDEARHALETNPNDAAAHYRLGLALASRGNVDEAMAHFRRTLRIKPEYPEAYYQIGLALADKGRLAEAITFYRRALELKPDFEEARQHLDKAIEANGGKTGHP